MDVFTIGFTQTTAEHFFDRLADAGVVRVLDIRLRNDSQLAGFAKARDLPYFLRELIGADYEHDPRLAPTAEIMDAFKKQKGSWEDFAPAFTALLAERAVEDVLDRGDFERPTALLCSEADAAQCHRSLVVAYLDERWGDMNPVHL
ncbi:MAG: DUF488 domain-containing protein [Solirubrobacterales bacterium]